MSEKMINMQHPVIKYGILGGLFYIAFTLVLYMMGISAFTGLWRFAPFIITIFIAFYAAMEIRSKQGGKIKFQDALVAIFLTYFIIELFWNSFNYVLYNQIDRDLAARVHEHQIEKIESWKESTNMDTDFIDDNFSYLQQEGNQDYTVRVFFSNLFIWALFGFVISLIGAGIMRKETNHLNNET